VVLRLNGRLRILNAHTLEFRLAPALHGASVACGCASANLSPPVVVLKDVVVDVAVLVLQPAVGVRASRSGLALVVSGSPALAAILPPAVDREPTHHQAEVLVLVVVVLVDVCVEKALSVVIGESKLHLIGATVVRERVNLAEHLSHFKQLEPPPLGSYEVYTLVVGCFLEEAATASIFFGKYF
jgi:hypothetical protein